MSRAVLPFESFSDTLAPSRMSISMISTSPLFAAECMGYFFFMHVFLKPLMPLVKPCSFRKMSIRERRRCPSSARLACSASSACRSCSSRSLRACSATRRVSACRASSSSAFFLALRAASSSCLCLASSPARHCTSVSASRCTSSARLPARHCAAISSMRCFPSSSCDMMDGALTIGGILTVSVRGLGLLQAEQELAVQIRLPGFC
mmetsp:Transcript_12938/g.26922  ORF Transcript_12938/g.26922 Transcript_12938/m.26922 type:complete len:206 (+) Transcript_12938:337-954(+)